MGLTVPFALPVPKVNSGFRKYTRQSRATVDSETAIWGVFWMLT